MNVTNFTEFYNLIKSCNLESNAPLDNFVKTVDQYITLCNCTNPKEKEIKLVESKRMYDSIIRGRISQFVVVIKAKKSAAVINFYSGGKLVKSY